MQVRSTSSVKMKVLIHSMYLYRLFISTELLRLGHSIGGSFLTLSGPGRVEMCYKKQWGTICSGYYNWESGYLTTLAGVICRQLGYSYFNATAYPQSYIYFGGVGSGGLYLYTPTILCTGNESRLQDCYHAPVGYHQCTDHYTDIGLECQSMYKI